MNDCCVSLNLTKTDVQMKVKSWRNGPLLNRAEVLSLVVPSKSIVSHVEGSMLVKRSDTWVCGSLSPVAKARLLKTISSLIGAAKTRRQNIFAVKYIHRKRQALNTKDYFRSHN